MEENVNFVLNSCWAYPTLVTPFTSSTTSAIADTTCQHHLWTDWPINSLKCLVCDAFRLVLCCVVWWHAADFSIGQNANSAHIPHIIQLKSHIGATAGKWKPPIARRFSCRLSSLVRVDCVFFWYVVRFKFVIAAIANKLKPIYLVSSASYVWRGAHAQATTMVLPMLRRGSVYYSLKCAVSFQRVQFPSLWFSISFNRL